MDYVQSALIKQAREQNRIFERTTAFFEMRIHFLVCPHKNCKGVRTNGLRKNNRSIQVVDSVWSAVYQAGARTNWTFYAAFGLRPSNRCENKLDFLAAFGLPSSNRWKTRKDFLKKTNFFELMNTSYTRPSIKQLREQKLPF